MDVAIGDCARLAGYDLVGLAAPPEGRPPAVKAGQSLAYTLYWKACDGKPQNYQTILRLVDSHGVPLTAVEHRPGQWFDPPLLWNSAGPQPDPFQLRVPAEVPSGLHWPRVTLMGGTRTGPRRC